MKASAKDRFIHRMAPVFVCIALALLPAAGGARGADAADHDDRPRLVVAPFELDPNVDPRDAWLAVAAEELLTWQLRRTPEFAVMPTQRLVQGRRELRAAAEEWPRVARLLGATHAITGRVAGQPSAVRMHLCAKASDGAVVAEWSTDPESLWSAVSAACAMVRERLAPAAPARDALAPPSRSMTAIEYFARAVEAQRREAWRDASRWAVEAVDADRSFRAANGLLAQLELRAGVAGRSRAVVRLKRLAHESREAADSLDRAAVEMAQSLLAQGEGSSHAAHTRAMAALELAEQARDSYTAAAAMAWVVDVLVTWNAAGDDASDAATRGVEAIGWQQRHIAAVEALGDQISATIAYTKLGLLQERAGAPAAALDAFRRAHDIAAAIASRGHRASAAMHIGQAHLAGGAHTEAIDAFNAALRDVDADDAPTVRMALAAAHRAAGDRAAAFDQYEQAAAALRAGDALAPQLACYRELARLAWEMGRQDAARQSLREAIDIARALESPEAAALEKLLGEWNQVR